MSISVGRSTRSALHCAALLVLAVTMAGCASMAGMQASVSPRAVPLGQALVIPPPGSAGLLGVIETRYVNATEQYITLETRARIPAQNYIKVQSFTRNAASATPGGLQDVPLAYYDLAGEARGTVNFADMKLSPYFVQNAYGPFGYSMGMTSTADLCMYAWQRIEPKLRPSGAVARGAINIRVQICDARKSEQELLALMLALHVEGATGIARAAPQLVGAKGYLVSPFVAGAFPGNVLPSRPRPAPAIATVVVEEPVSPVPSGRTPVVPSPAGGPVVPVVPSAPAPLVPSPRRRPVSRRPRSSNRHA